MNPSSASWSASIPNAISSVRIILAPILLMVAFLDRDSAFLMVFALSLITDFLDGLLARLLHAESQWGARLDSWGDSLSWIAFAGGALILWPDRILAMKFWVGAALLAFLIPGLYGLFKYHQLPSFHTWSAKAAMAGMGGSVLLLFWNITPIPFYACIYFLGIVCLEETLMVHWLPEPRTDLGTARQAWKLRQNKG